MLCALTRRLGSYLLGSTRLYMLNNLACIKLRLRAIIPFQQFTLKSNKKQSNYYTSKRKNYLALLLKQSSLALLSGLSDSSSRLLHHGGVRVQLHQCSHVGKRIALNGCATDHLPVIQNQSIDHNALQTIS